MARVKFTPNELDQNYQIEDGIGKTLDEAPSAEVAASVVEKCYELLDENDAAMPGTLEQKCHAIADKFNARYSINGENVIFKRKKPR